MRSLLLALLILAPLLVLQLQRRSHDIARQEQESRDDTQATMELLDRGGAARIAFTDPAFSPSSYSALIGCIQADVRRLADLNSTVRLVISTMVI